MPKNTQVMLMKDLSVELGSNKVLNEVNLAMSAGERLAIVGPSGSGKSTILRLLAGLLLPSNGSLQISGIEQKYLRLDQNDPPESGASHFFSKRAQSLARRSCNDYR